MKAAEKKQLMRAICAQVPNMHAKGGLLAATPRGRILRGLFLEDSSDPMSIYLWAFVQPLYVPATTISFNLGQRLGGGTKTWSSNDSASVVAIAREEGVPFFGPLVSPEALATWSVLEGRTGPHSIQARAYSLVAAGRYVQGIKVLRELIQSLRGGTPWMIEMQRRAERLADVAESAPKEAQDLLAGWEADTVAALKLEDIP